MQLVETKPKLKDHWWILLQVIGLCVFIRILNDNLRIPMNDIKVWYSISSLDFFRGGRGCIFTTSF